MARSLSLLVLLLAVASAKIGPAGQSINVASGGSFFATTPGFANNYVLISSVAPFSNGGNLSLAVSTGSSFKVVDHYATTALGVTYPTGPSSATYLEASAGGPEGMVFDSYKVDISSGKIKMTSVGSFSFPTEMMPAVSPVPYVTQAGGVFILANSAANATQSIWRYDIFTYQWKLIVNITTTTIAPGQVISWTPTDDESAIILASALAPSAHPVYQLSRFDMKTMEISDILPLEEANEQTMYVTTFPSSNAGIYMYQTLNDSQIFVVPYDFDTMTAGTKAAFAGSWDNVLIELEGVAMVNGNLFFAYINQAGVPSLAQANYAVSPPTIYQPLEDSVPVMSWYSPAADAKYVYVLEGSADNGFATSVTRYPYN